ncbi:MAG: tRNA epoxyqueuosine(34) reductase QueG [Planctomycetota bacterium]
MGLTDDIAAAALELGFDLVGAAPLRPPRGAERFRSWLSEGHHADMHWLVRNADRIADPRQVLEGGTAILVVGLGHARAAEELEGGGRIARYALGRDYHNVVGKRLRKLARRVEEIAGARRTRAIVDAGPLLERSHAAEAGLGFESRSANLLDRRFGPWFFLGELLVEIEGYEPEPARPAPGSCGTCRACIDACPTGAIVADGVVDARRCISYLTIENRGAVPRDLRSRIGTWVFGCDVCSEVCPFGHRAPDRSDAFGTHAAVAGGRLADWFGIGDAEFAERFEGSPLRRAGREGLARNAAIVLGNAPSDAGREALGRALEDPSPRVREAAAWGLVRGHAHDPSARAAVERARGREVDPDARADIEGTLGDI